MNIGRIFQEISEGCFNKYVEDRWTNIWRMVEKWQTLSLVPFPQLTEHADQEPHSPQVRTTGGDWVYCFLVTVITGFNFNIFSPSLWKRIFENIWSDWSKIAKTWAASWVAGLCLESLKRKGENKTKVIIICFFWKNGENRETMIKEIIWTKKVCRIFFWKNKPGQRSRCLPLCTFGCEPSYLDGRAKW